MNSDASCLDFAEKSRAPLPEATTSKRRCNLDATKFNEASSEKLTMLSGGDGHMENAETPVDHPGPMVEAEKVVSDSKALEILSETSASPGPKLQPMPAKVNTRSNKGVVGRNTPKAARRKKSREEPKKVEVATTKVVKCTLMECEENATGIVAFGRLQVDQNRLHGRQIPDDCYVVMVTLIAQARYPLPFPNTNDDPEQVVMADACQSIVIWPTEFVKVD